MNERQKAENKGESTRASISVPNLSAFAPLREIADFEGGEEGLTLRRQGAKKTYRSKHRISSLNLSDLAALRENSVTPKKEVFAQRRQDAKDERLKPWPV
ncbi:MAG: hypothetical protein QOH39_3169 [Verrucomicrobiota bacterium]|jgi:hypothetical protein